MIITPKIPYPLNEGGKISQFAIIDYLRRIHSVILVLATYTDEDEKNVDILKQLWPEVIVEKIQMWNSLPQIPEKFLNKTGLLPLARLKRFSRGVKKLVKTHFHNDKYELSTIPEIESPWIVHIAAVKNRRFIDSLLKIVNNYKIDLIQIDMLDYIDLALVLPKEIKKVFVHHEIRFARLATTLKTLPTIPTAYEKYVFDFVKNQEINFLRLYDEVFVFSEEDRKILVNLIPEKKIVVAPFPVLDSYFRTISPDLFQIKKLVFVGGEDHMPNKDAMEWYIKEIGIEVRKKLDLTLHIIGNWSKETIEKYKDNDLVCFAGFIEDLISYCENSIMVVPIRIGSGIRAKIMYAMAQGIPVVSAPIGCEGIQVTDKVDLLIANTPNEFAEAINTIAKNPELAFTLVSNAQRVVMEKYSQKNAVELRQKYFIQLTNNNKYNVQ
jgi:glycosyltransferase involved in cell wall biosynthesis